jgi:hypothetical protein
MRHLSTALLVLSGLLIGSAVGNLIVLALTEHAPTTWHGYQIPHPAVTKNLKGQYDC